MAMPAQKRDRAPNEDVRVIAITSGKGGVGKTHIAANLACILSGMGKRVLVLDADAGLANIDIILGLKPKYNLHHVLTGEKTMPEVIVSGPGGIGILPAASGIQEMTNLSRGQKFTLLDELNALSEDIDLMLIDTAAGIADNVMYFNMAAKEIVVVVSPEPTSMTDAYALIKVLYKAYGEKRFMLLVNMVKNADEAGRVYRRLSRATEHFLDVFIDYLGYIPQDRSVREAILQQKPLVKIYPSSPASKSLFSVAEKLCQEQPESYGGRGLKFFWDAAINGNHG